MASHVVLYCSIVWHSFALETQRIRLDWNDDVGNIGLVQKHVALLPSGPRTPTAVSPRKPRPAAPGSTSNATAPVAPVASLVPGEQVVRLDGNVPDVSNLMAQPTVEPGVTLCASTRNDGKELCPECVFQRECFCTGWVRLGYGLHWTRWQEVGGFISCETGSFDHTDPVMNHGKVCQCASSMPDVTNETVAAEEDNRTTAWWKPVFFTTGFSIPIVSALGLAHVGCFEPDSVTAAVLEAGASASGHATMLAVAFVMAAKGSDGTLNSADAVNSTEGVAGSLIRKLFAPSQLKSKSAVYPDFSEDPYENFCCYTASAAFIVQLFARLYYEYKLVLIERRQEGRIAEDDYRLRSLRLWKRINHIGTAVMYIALTVLLVGAISDDNVTLSTAEFCALALIVGYFGVHLVFYIVSLEVSSRFAAAVAKLSALNLAFAPMVALLCLIVQVQADSVGEVVTKEQEGFMERATTMVLVQALVATLQPLCLRSNITEVAHNEQEDIVIKRSRGALIVVSIIRWIQIAYLYYMCFNLSTGLWNLADMTSKERTQWMAGLSIAFFTGNSIQWTALTLRQFQCIGMRAVQAATILKELVSPLPVINASILGWWILTPDAVPW